MSHTKIPYGDPGVAQLQTEDFSQVDVWTGPIPTKTTNEPIGENTTLALYEVVGKDVNGDLKPATFGGAGAKARGVLVATDVFLDGETITIGTQVYTMVDVLASADDVFIGATTQASIDNLIAAINAGVGEGTVYGVGTVQHPAVSAAQGVVDAMEVEANQPGQAGEIASTETSATAAWGAATLVGGAGGVVPLGIMGGKAVTAGGENITMDIWRDGTWNPNALVWDASFNDDAKKKAAFDGAPAPTAIIIAKNIHDNVFA